MSTIRKDDLVESVAAALQYISYFHPVDYIRSLGRAFEAEASPAARDAIAQILTNSRMCAEGRRPICQDTGIVNVFLKVGMDVRWDGFERGLDDAVNEGVRRAYLDPDNKLRASIVDPPEGARRNTRDNTPAVIQVDLVPGHEVDYHEAHPRTALLLVEVAEWSLPQDRVTKRAIYAAAGVPEYWIVNLRDGWVEVLRAPDRRARRHTETSIAHRGELPGITKSSW